jgi:competence protein ComEA
MATVGPGTPTTAPTATQPAAETTAPATSVTPAGSTGKINVNTATASALEALPGIGPTKAAAIVSDREQNGPYASCDDLARVSGIGPATVSSVRDLCTVE